MQHDFWHHKWQAGEIGFHLQDVNPLLVQSFDQLAIQSGSRIFLPLCGKTQDIHWLISQGYRVVGAELSQLAIAQLFDELALTPTITRLDKLIHYQAEQIDIFVGDIFDLTPALIGSVDAIYDRAALVALPITIRPSYAAHLISLSQHHAPQLVICFVYDQQVMSGPPFSVNAAEVMALYQSDYKINLLDSVEVVGGLKGKCSAIEQIWLLTS